MSKEDKIKVLYVDDEINNLHGFKATYRMDYNVFIANNTDEALNILREHPDMRVILSDQRMPDKTGVQFFEDVRKEFPSPVRMLITGYTDVESVIESINRGNIFRYIKKPWTDFDIKSAIDEGNKFYLSNTTLAIRNEELQKAYNELDKFAYSVTHDMRGPLLSILGAIDLARENENMDEIKEMLGMMDKSIIKLDNFIQSIHDYYNLNRGELQIVDVDFQKIVNDLKDIYGVGGLAGNVQFDVQINQSEPFRSDDMSLRIILNNLLSNAFKYQRRDEEHKKVSLSIEVNKGIATILVADNGIGIDEAHVNDIFNMFYRATTEEVGSGFGLYNVKDALNKLNGDIKVSSTLKEGSTFTVTIPTK
ncbi:MAG: hybrid sensor histidine kinase/response regulator [Flavipsychrobacter sp.]|nr:hybrid sensor histidine kinase/response regulator [Flavipsychrobacter sp.]